MFVKWTCPEFYLSTLSLVYVYMCVFLILWLIYFVTKNLYLNLHLFLSSAHFLSLWLPPICTLNLWLCFCLVMFVDLLCFSNSTYKLNHMVFVFLWLISISIIPSKSIHVVTNGNVSFFFMTSILLYIYICVCICIYTYRYIYIITSSLAMQSLMGT